MKKPKITEGDWKLSIENEYAEVYTDSYTICTDACNEDSQAISAVPEMIDALIDCVLYLRNDEKWDRIKKDSNLKLNAEQALKKAGVQL